MQQRTTRKIGKSFQIVLVVFFNLVAWQSADATPDEDCYNAVVRGRQMVANNDLANALVTFRAAQRMSPVDSRPYFWIGYCLERTGDLNGAVKAYSACLDSAKSHSMDSAELRIDLGNTLCKLNYFKEAIFDYKRALVIDPSLTVAHVCLARAYVETNDWLSATQELDFCQAHSIWAPELAYLRALTLCAQGARSDALKQIETFISSNQRTLQNSMLMQKALTLQAELQRP